MTTMRNDNKQQGRQTTTSRKWTTTRRNGEDGQQGKQTVRTDGDDEVAADPHPGPLSSSTTSRRPQVKRTFFCGLLFLFHIFLSFYSTKRMAKAPLTVHH